ncbi:hypothetical protein FisN_26Lh022 [Fistulifera solaris]|uniref:Ig-like domain-containing protein n=1 Tax=Fistulifera solaris TaxID=1519565 RepID=A0A1Z5KCN9_FISSO|nr:hypothetical protein FisN_26Lh022 [Fistulifera solaris]|eukprot:GAX23966.1 hypothetical protein FisN_26Lh022 [Fistulifera solaris]
MRRFVSCIFLAFSLVPSVTDATEVLADPEPLTYQEKEAMLHGNGNRRSMRELQSSLSYKGQICSSETQGMMACGTYGTQCQPDQWEYWLLNLQIGTEYVIEVDRVICGMDPALVLYDGIGTTFPLGCVFEPGNTTELTWIAEADDNDQVPAYCFEEFSPFGDPKITVIPDTEGPFTLAVVNYGSDTGSCTGARGFQYKVIINPPPSCP